MRKSHEFHALYPVVGVESPQQTAAAFRRLLGLEPVFETDWYVHLRMPGGDLQIGLVRFDHPSVPPTERRPLAGTAAFVTVDAADVAAVWNSHNADLDVVVPLADEAWGQRHFICRLPGDVMVDVVQMLPAPA